MDLFAISYFFVDMSDIAVHGFVQLNTDTFYAKPQLIVCAF